MYTKLIMNLKYFTLLLVIFSYFNCTKRKVYGDENPDFFAERFDSAFYRYLTNNEPENELSQYIPFLKVFGENILDIGNPDDTDFYSKLNEYFANPAIMSLYNDQQTMFSDISDINSELSRALDYFLKQFSEIKKPKVYMHVSGWEQKVVVTDDFLSLSADFYLGEDYPYYQDFFYDYQRKQMKRERVVPDYLLGFMMANLPFEGNEEILLEKMLYEGKLAYILSRLLPDRQIWDYVGYDKDEYLWCSNNQGRIWKTILQNQHLFTPNYRITSQYLKESPHTAFLPEESPGKVGVWVGYQIIIAYMKNNPDTSLSDLMKLNDYQEILKQSKYKPEQ